MSGREESHGSRPAPAGDRAVVQRLLDGDEATFTELVGQCHGRLVRLARSFVKDQATAEEVVQDTWLGVLKGLHGFEGRSALKTWILRILVNRVKTRAIHEARQCLEEAIERLPARQRTVLVLRDIERISAEEVCNILEITDTNQRVLLHRARSALHRVLERYLDEE